jgi:preprotein translocase subunit SecE
MIDKIKIVVALLIVAAGIAGFYLLSEHAMFLRVLAVLGGVIAGLAVAWTTPVGKSGFAFARESFAEAGRVVWPSRKETMQTTLVVFGLVLVMALFLWVVDIGFLWMVKVLMGRSA